MPKARSVSDVILGEATSGTPQQRYEDMKAIASAIVNRAQALGVTPEQVVSNSKEFNAYGRSLPAGVSAYRSLADQAMNDVLTNGPTHKGTFYATPSAADNLPKGLLPETQTAGHVYYSDPKNRAIGTSLGYRSPQTQPETAQQAISGLLSTEAQPASPSERMGLLNSYAPQGSEMAPLSSLQPQQAQSSPAEQYASYGAGKQQARMNDLLSQDVSQQRAMDGLKQGLLAQQTQMASGVDPMGGPLDRPFDQAGTLQKTSRVPEAQPADLASQYASYGAGKQPTQLAGLLGQDVAYQGLIDGLNAQKSQLTAGVNPMETAAPWKQPEVTTVQAPEAQQVQTPEVAYQPVQPVAQPEAFSGGLLPQEQAAAFAQAPRDVKADQALARKVGLQMGATKLMGGLGGGLLGGMALGPLGGLLGGLLGKNLAARSYHPPAPSGQKSPKGSDRLSYAGLSEQGRTAYNDSKQVRDIVDKGSVGLY